jgi:putative acetyltransferase
MGKSANVTQVGALAVRPESLWDCAGIALVNDLAFGREEESRLVSALRKGGYGRLSLVAEENGDIVGHIYFSRLPIVNAAGVVEALALAPMAVLPSHQRRGIGTRLVKEGLRRCTEDGHKIVIVLGHADYYPRFGFSARLAEPLASPFGGGPSWMALDLVPGALNGVAGRVEYPPPFGVFE